MTRAFSRIASAALALTLTTATVAVAQQPAPAPAAPQAAAQVSPAQLALGREIIVGSGMARSFEALIPTFSEQIKQLFVTRPEVTKDLDTVLDQIRPEIEKKKEELVTSAARMMASRINEADLRQIVAFFSSDAGKHYVETQPVVLNDIFDAMRTWANDTAEFTLTRVREEMKKKGHTL